MVCDRPNKAMKVMMWAGLLEKARNIPSIINGPTKHTLAMAMRNWLT